MFNFKESTHQLIEIYGEDPQSKKIRLMGREKAKQKYNLETPINKLLSVYLDIEKKAGEATNSDDNTFLWGACEYIGDLLKKLGQPLPKTKNDSWSR